MFNAGTFSARHPVEVEIYAVRLVPRRSPRAWASTSAPRPPRPFSIDPDARARRRDSTPAPSAPRSPRSRPSARPSRTGRRGRACTLRFLGVGTTGAGRKFIGSLVKADLVVDEITAHARAAYALDPAIDTIIEIGGQDAKFTTMRDGMVTFSHMNTVCAAGTGSFLEEQAARLGCEPGRLRATGARRAGARCPATGAPCSWSGTSTTSSRRVSPRRRSSPRRCTACGRTTCTKVARGAAIGERIAFQGATARNKALVAAFREGLGKPILVSRYCHLTGALGRGPPPCRGRGSAASRFHRPCRRCAARSPCASETCALCGNHCRLRIATVAGETVAYGFLCGRDYDASRYVDRNTSGFDLLKERAQGICRRRDAGPAPPATRRRPPSASPRPSGSTASFPSGRASSPCSAFRSSPAKASMPASTWAGRCRARSSARRLPPSTAT